MTEKKKEKEEGRGGKMTTRKVTLFIFFRKTSYVLSSQKSQGNNYFKMSSYKAEQRCTECMKDTTQKGGKKEDTIVKKRKEKSIFMASVSLDLPLPCANSYYYPELYWTFPAQTEKYFKCCLCRKKKKKTTTPK